MKEYKSKLERLSLVREKTDIPRVQIINSEDAYNYIKQFYHEDMTIYESFFILLTNNARKTIGYVKISQGGVSGTVVDVRIVAKYVVETLASGIILAHNHPSGSLNPSQSDKDLTRKISNALKFFDCLVLDHIILSDVGYFSFMNEEIM